MIVIDPSSLVKYLLREEGWKEVEQHLEKGVLTIDHAKKETLNAVWKHCKIKHIIDLGLAKKLHNVLNELIEAKILLVEDENKYVDKAFRITLDHDVTMYDALYIAQASKWGQLLTSDRLQRKAAEEIKLKVIFVP